MAQFQRHFVQELTEPIRIRQCGDLGFTGDNDSDVISVDLYTNGEEYAGGGECAGACIRPDGTTLALTGSVSGKTASVSLKEHCFDIPGQIGIGIRVTTGTTKTTVLKAIYNVELFATDTPVDPGSQTALDVADLINRIDTAVASIPASADQLKAAMAPNFSTTTVYPAGAYVWNNGNLYRFTTIHTAGSWTGTDAIQIAIGDDVSHAKKTAEYATDKVSEIQYSVGDMKSELGFVEQTETVSPSIGTTLTKPNSGKLAIMNPYFVDGKLQKVIASMNIGNVVGNTGKLHCCVIDPDVISNFSGMAPDAVPYIAHGVSDVTAIDTSTPQTAVNITFDFSSLNLSYHHVLYIMFYVVADVSGSPVFLRCLNYYADNPDFPKDFVATSDLYPNYAMNNGSTALSVFSATGNYYNALSLKIIREKTVLENEYATKADITALESEISDIESDVTWLTSTVSGAVSDIAGIKPEISELKAGEAELSVSLDTTDEALGLTVTEETITKSVNYAYQRDNTGRLAVANPYNINGVVQKVIANVNIGNTAGNTGKLFCRLVDAEIMKTCVGKTLAQVPYIAEKQAEVTATASSSAGDAVNITYDFTDLDIPFSRVLYILLYVSPDSSLSPIYIRTMRAGVDYGDFSAASATVPNYAILNGSTVFTEQTYDKNYYLGISAEIEAITKSTTVGIGNPWVNKIAVAYGSSLSQNGGWTDVLKQRFGFSKMYNRGSGGTTLTDLSSYGLSNYVTSITVYNDSAVWGESRSTCYYDATDIPPGYENYAHTATVTGWQSGTTRLETIPVDADLVLIDLCTNDFFRIANNNIDYDTVMNTPIVKTSYQQSVNPYPYDVKKYGDAFALLVKTIQSRCPNAKIVVWGMLYNTSITNNNSTLFEVWNKMYDHTKMLCSMFGVYFIDMRYEDGMNVFNVSQYCEDGVHPYKPTYATEKGKYAVANVLTKHLMNLYPKDYMSI